jgi:pantetheine-phosphate adenylyltransferase
MANSGLRVAIYPGSFDPVTNGHLDLIRRSAKLVDRLIVAVLNNASKQPLFSVEERKAMLKEVTADLVQVEVDSFDGLLVEYAGRRGAQVIVRGIRGISDYETEMQMALLNRHLRPGTETIFLMAAAEYSVLSSRMVKEVVGLGGDVSGFVPEAVWGRLKGRLRNETD